MHYFDSDNFNEINNLTFIVFTFIVPVCDLGMSFGKVKSENLYSKLRRNLGNSLEHSFIEDNLVNVFAVLRALFTTGGELANSRSPI